MAEAGVLECALHLFFSYKVGEDAYGWSASIIFALFDVFCVGMGGYFMMVVAKCLLLEVDIFGSNDAVGLFDP